MAHGVAASSRRLSMTRPDAAWRARLNRKHPLDRHLVAALLSGIFRVFVFVEVGVVLL